MIVDSYSFFMLHIFINLNDKVICVILVSKKVVVHNKYDV